MSQLQNNLIVIFLCCLIILVLVVMFKAIRDSVRRSRRSRRTIPHRLNDLEEHYYKLSETLDRTEQKNKMMFPHAMFNNARDRNRFFRRLEGVKARTMALEELWEIQSNNINNSIHVMDKKLNDHIEDQADFTSRSERAHV